MPLLLSASERRAMLSDYGDAVTIGGIAVAGRLQLDYSDEGGISSRTPVLTLTDEDVSAYTVTEGTTVIAEGTTYTVQYLERAGGGLTRARLVEA